MTAVPTLNGHYFAGREGKPASLASAPMAHRGMPRLMIFAANDSRGIALSEPRPYSAGNRGLKEDSLPCDGLPGGY